MNLEETLRLYADSAGTGSEPADSSETDEKSKAYTKKNGDAYDKLRRKVGPRGEDRGPRKALRPFGKLGMKGANALDPSEDMDNERLKQQKKKRERLCTVCTPGVLPGRNITGSKKRKRR